MSKQVDERVVSMQFDNQHFERNVSTTMSTLDKLKQKLHLPGAAKGLDDVNKAAQKVNFTPMGQAIESVQAKFSALQVIGITALSNITNSAMNAGKKIIAALTIDPVKTGFQEYETQINATQTILSNTKSKGSTIDDVNNALEELNKYADKTIYNFTEMTRNIGTFTAAGIDLETSVNAIQGIANLAAVSGSTSQQASTAMYQLSQALASGTVKLMDWNSVVNAGMGGEMFQNALKETSEALGTGAEAAIKAQGSFRESLTTGWLTAEVLTETLKKFTTTGANERVAEYTGLSKEAVEAALESAKAQYGEAEAIEYASKALAKKSGKNAEEIKSVLEFAKDAEDAATKVKTFTQLWDVMKESAQSGWAQSWKIIIGDFEAAKNLFTPLADTLTGILNGMSEARNRILEGVFGNPFAKKFADLTEKLKSVTNGTEALGTALKALKDPAEVVDSVIRGDWGHMQERWDRLTEAGYDWIKVQNLVNEKLGSSFRRAEKTEEVQSDLNKTQAKTIEQLVKMSDAELKNLGFTPEQIASFRELEEYSRKTGISIESLIEDIDQLSGRNLLINSFKNIGKMLVDIFKKIKEGWQEIFPPKSEEERISQIYDLIAAFHKFTMNLNENGETANKLKRTFKGVFALLDVILTIVGGPIKIVFKAFSQLLGVLGFDILDVTAYLGDALVSFRDWINSVLDFTGIFEKMLPGLKNFGKSIRDWIDGLKEADNIPKYILEGLLNGLMTYGSKAIEWIRNLGQKIIDGIKDILGIHSPSTVFFEIGKNIIEGLILGIKFLASSALELIKNIGSQCVEIFKNIDFGQLLAIALSGAAVALGKKTLDVIAMFAKPLVKVGDAVEDFGDMMEGIGSYFKGAGALMRSKALKNMAISIAILAGSLLLLTLIPKDKLTGALITLGLLTGVIVGLAFVAKMLSVNIAKDSKITPAVMSLMMLAGSLLIVAGAFKLLSTISIGDSIKAFVVITLAIGLLTGVLLAFSALTKGPIAKHVDKAGAMLLKLSIALLIMAVVVKLAGSLNPEHMIKGLMVMGIMSLFVAGLVAVSRLAGEHASKAGSMLLKISFALLVMVAVVKLAGMLSPDEVSRGIYVVGLVSGLFSALMIVSKFAGGNASKAGTMMLTMSLAIMVMVGVVKMVAGISESDLVKGIVVISLFAGMCTALMFVSKYAGEHAAKAGVMMLAISAALIIMTGVVFLLGQINIRDLIQGTIAIIMLGGIVAGLIAVTKLAQTDEGMQKTLVKLTIVIVLLAAAIVGLSFLDPSKLKNVSLALSLVMGAFAGIIAATNLAKNTKSMRKTLLQLLGVTLILGGIVAGLSFINPINALGSAIALSVLLTAFASAMVLLGHTGRISTTVQKNMLPLLAVVLGLATILSIMSLLDVTASIPSAIALGMLLNAMAAALIILSYAGKTSMAAVGTMAVLALVVGELGLVLGLMSHFGVEASIPTAIAMSVLLVTMAGILPILAAVGPVASMAMMGVLALAVLIAAIGALVVGIGYLMTEFPQLETFLDKGIPILEKIGYAIGSFFGNIVGGFMSGSMSGLPEIGTILTEFISNAQGFINGVTNIDDGFGAKVAALTAGILLLTAADFIAGITNFVSGGGGFAQLGADLSAFMMNALPFITGTKLIDESAMEGIKTLAEAILIITAAELLDSINLFGNSSLDSFGEKLPGLGDSLNAFATSLGSFGEDQVKSITNGANAIKAIASAAQGIPNEGGWLAAIVGDNDIGTFGAKLPQLGTHLKEFATNLNGFSEDQIKVVENGAKAIKAIAEVAEGIPNEGGWLAAIVGDNDIAIFGAKLPQLGTHLKEFATNLNGFSEDQIKVVENGAKAIKAISEVAEGIPNEGGWLAKIVGDNDIATFGAKLPDLGKNLKDFATNLGEFGDEQVFAAQKGCEAIVAIAQASESIPSENAEWIKKLVGDNSISTFAAKLPGLGKNLGDFCSNLGGFNETGIEAARCAVETIKVIAEVANYLDENGLDGEDNLLTTFGSDMAGLGGKMYDFSKHISDIDPTKISSVKNFVKTMCDIAKSVKESELHDGSLYTFGSDMAGLGGKLYDFNNNVKDIDPTVITAAVSCITSVTNAAKDIAKVDSKGVKNAADAFRDMANVMGVLSKVSSTSADGFTQSLAALGEANVDAFVDAFSDLGDDLGKIGTSAIESFIKAVSAKFSAAYDVGKELMARFNLGLKSNADKAKIAFTTAIQSCINEVTLYTGTFRLIGMNLASSFAAGISANAYMAAARARAMAKAAAEAAEDELDINSPSKVFRAIGKSVPEGFAQGIDRLGYVVNASSTDMAKSAVSNVKDAISRMSDVINSDIDSQPTIRPVLDLSNVKSGASTIDNMLTNSGALSLNTNSAVGLTTSLRRIQNGNNSDEIVSAMKGLRKDIANMPRNNYNLNGIEYSEGDDVAEALKTIVRAAKVERRN